MSNSLATFAVITPTSSPVRRSSRVGIERMFHSLPKGTIEKVANNGAWKINLDRELSEERGLVKEALLLTQKAVSRVDRHRVFVAGSSVLYEELARLDCLEKPWGAHSVNDIDAFLVGGGSDDPRAFRLFIGRVKNNLRNLGVDIARTVSYKHHYSTSLKEFRVVDMYIEGLPKLSFIQAWFHDTPQDVVADFDINVVKIYWPLSSKLEQPFHMVPDLLAYLKSGQACVMDIIVVDGNFRGKAIQFFATAARTVKYESRGFSFVRHPVLKIFTDDDIVREFQAVDNELFEVHSNQEGEIWVDGEATKFRNISRGWMGFLS